MQARQRKALYRRGDDGEELSDQQRSKPESHSRPRSPKKTRFNSTRPHTFACPVVNALSGGLTAMCWSG
jgi:hypothetical protein